MPQKLIKTSVRELVGLALRSGSLGGGGFVGTNRMVEGTRGHQKLQRTRPDNYQSEVAVSYRVDSGDLELEISGRIDGVQVDERSNGSPQVLIEEIKTTDSELNPERPDNPHHWGQAKIYAYILAEQNNLDQIHVQLTYLQLESDETLEDVRVFSMEELAAFFEDVVSRYLQWAQIYHEWTLERDASIKDLAFPYAKYRPGQRPLAVAVYRTIEARKKLFAQAPTGIGKTISTLFPAIKAMGEGHLEKIFYLTAKTMQRTVAEKAFTDLRAQGLKLKSLTLTAKDKICFNATGGQSCDPEQCEFAIGYYDRLNGALEEIFQHDTFTRPLIEEIARKHTVCPFEFSLDLSLWSDAVICDYNYVFDPKAFLKRFFEDNSGNYAFLIDEAHNLVDRAREMFSAEIRKVEVSGLRTAVKKDHPHLARLLKEVNAYFVELGKRCSGEGETQTWVDTQLPQPLLPLFTKFLRQAEKILSANRPTAYHDQLVDFYFQVSGFLRIAELFDPHYITYAEKFDKDLRLRLFCRDPSHLIGEALKRGTTAVFFSATLTPLAYFRQILSGAEDDPCMNLDSPFPPEHLNLLVADHIETTYKKRGETYGDVAAAIAAVVGEKKGNYLVFFPSYRYMEEVAERFCQAYPNIEILVQTTGMSEPQREAFLAVFDADNLDTVVGFAVMGGIFGEGIDLVGDRLVGAVIVGVGLPQICLERDLIRDYYDERDASGFTYAYTYPGMNRVLQAAGRVIRSESDRGVVLLIDQRFSQSRYRKLFPPAWNGGQSARSVERISQAVEAFWQE